MANKGANGKDSGNGRDNYTVQYRRKTVAGRMWVGTISVWAEMRFA